MDFSISEAEMTDWREFIVCACVGARARARAEIESTRSYTGYNVY